MWQTDPRIAAAQSCVRERMAAAQTQVQNIEESIGDSGDILRQQLTRVQELKRSIADLETIRAHIRSCGCRTNMCAVAGEKEELGKPQTDELRHYSYKMERHTDLMSTINGCKQTLDSLTGPLSMSGLKDLCGDALCEWLCDIGMRKLQTALKDVDGRALTMLNVSDVMEYDVSFNDAATLLLRGYIAHYKLSDDSAFPPPSGSVPSWDQVQTANWIKTLGDSYSCLATSGWHGAALCSLSPPRVIEASKGALTAVDAVTFIELVCHLRSETDSDKATWVSKWSGASTIDNQAV